MNTQVPPKDGLQQQFSNKTPLTRVRGMTVNCGVCTIPVKRSPYQLIKSTNTYCSKACLWESLRRQVECECVVCSEKYFVKASNVSRVFTCSDVCHAEYWKRLCDAGINSIGKFRDDGGGKLSPEDWKSILESKLAKADLAAVYGVHRNTIHRARKRITSNSGEQSA